MTKQEQIEEMAKILESVVFSKNDKRKLKYIYAEKLYNEGYRKISEGSVVMAKEEFNGKYKIEVEE